MNNKSKKNKISPLKNTKNRIVIALVLLVIIIGAVAIVWHWAKESEVNFGAANSVSAPRIQSLPGSQHASNQYVKDQNVQNQQKSAASRKKAQSFVPTITRPDFSGSIDDFLQDSSKKSSHKAVCPIKKLVVMYKPNPASCTVKNLRLAHTSGVTAEELVCQGCSCPALKLAGYSVGDLKDIGFTAKQLRKCGFTINQLVSAGFSAKALKDAGFTAKQLANAGFTAGQLAASGFSPDEIIKAGYSPAELKAGGIYDLKKNKNSLCTAKRLKAQRAAGVSVAVLKQEGCGLAALKAAGFTAKQLKDGGFSASQLVKAGFTVAQLKTAGFSPAEIKAAELANKACDLNKLQKDHVNGISAKQLRDKGCGLAALKAAGYSSKELKDAGYSAAQLKSAGFNAAQLKNAGFSASQLKAAGYSAKELKDAGFTAAQLKNVGFNAGQLAAAGFDAKSLAAAGFSVKDLKNAGFSASQLKAAGFSAKELKAAGFSKGDLLRAGFSPKKAGYIEPKRSNQSDDRQTNGDNSQSNRDYDQKRGTTNHNASASMPSVGNSTPEDKLRRIAELQQAAMSRQQRQDNIAQMQAAMMAQGQTLMQNWSSNNTQTMAAAKHRAVSLASSHGGGNTKDQGPTYKAGTVLFAVIDTSINSDEKSPILAHVVDGPLKGAKLLGVFNRVNKKLLISFNLLNIPSYSTSTGINAVAIDPDDARTSIGGEVNNHYLLRYGTLFASSFLQGIGESLKGINTSVVVNPTSFGGITFSKTPPNVLEGTIQGLGVVGSRFSSQLAPLYNTPPTIKIQSGTGIGVLIMKDLKLPHALPVTEAQIATGNSSVGDYN